LDSYDEEVRQQREYYASIADRYHDKYVNEDDEHSLALNFLLSVVERIGIGSVLDIGSGTGRALLKFKEKMPGITAVGIEPSLELRRVGYAKGLSETELMEGDGQRLSFEDSSFDVVCEFGVLHHMPKPSQAVAEMLRVARKAIFISDSNNFGQGSWKARLVKQTLDAAGLWPIADRIKTRGKGYLVSEGDGLFYSYSVFNDYRQIERACKSVHLLSTSGSGPNLYRTSTHVALLGIKPPSERMEKPSGADNPKR
jgi:ubiquinone/menaquinone biosynthesis C-methylase UbiE